MIKFIISFGLINKKLLILLIYLISEIINDIITDSIPDDASNSIIFSFENAIGGILSGLLIPYLYKSKKQKSKKSKKNSFIYFFYLF